MTHPVNEPKTDGQPVHEHALKLEASECLTAMLSEKGR